MKKDDGKIDKKTQFGEINVSLKLWSAGIVIQYFQVGDAKKIKEQISYSVKASDFPF